MSAFLFRLVLLAAILRQAQVMPYESGHRDIGFVAVLLEELPLQNPRAVVGILGQKTAALGQEVQNRVGFAEESAVLEFQQRNLPGRVLCEEFVRPRFALENIDIDPLVGKVEQGREQLDLVAVSGLAIAVNFHVPFLNSSAQS